MKEKITSERLIQAIIKSSNKKDLYRITLQDVANELGIKPPSLYNHINGIDDMYLKIGVYGVEVLTNNLVSASIGLSGRDALYAIAQAYYAFAVEQPVLINAIENPFIVKNISMNTERKKVVSLILTVLKNSGYEEEESIHMIRVLRSYLYGFSKLQSDSLHQIDLDLETSFNMGLNAILDGFKLGYRI
jgi:AcrR family transcriptional regulator